MRIEAYNQVQQIYNNSNIAKAKAEKKKGLSDQLQISSIGQDIRTAKAAMAECSDIREEKTAPLKAKIAAGTYQVSIESFAEKLAEQYKEMR